MNFNTTDFIRLTENHQILPFDCGDKDEDKDLNNFLLNDAKDYYNKLLAVTYILEADGVTSAFFCVSNDNISIEKVDSKNQWQKLFKRRMPQNKRFDSYPAVKIGRLATHKNYQGSGLGTALLDFIKAWFISDNRTGCMYITVDAYRQSLRFYEKNDFLYLSKKDENAKTRLMYYNLAQLK